MEEQTPSQEQIVSDFANAACAIARQLVRHMNSKYQMELKYDDAAVEKSVGEFVKQYSTQKLLLSMGLKLSFTETVPFPSFLPVISRERVWDFRLSGNSSVLAKKPNEQVDILKGGLTNITVGIHMPGKENPDFIYVHQICPSPTHQIQTDYLSDQLAKKLAVTPGLPMKKRRLKDSRYRF